MASLNDEMVYLSVPITKATDAGDGSVYVEGLCTDDGLDLDDQIIDKDFAARGLQQWFSDFANVRAMHSTNIPPAGKAVELEARPEGTWVRTKVVEPGAVKLVKEGVYQAYSVGISRPRIIRDGVAKNGRVVDGVFSEISLVDFPANPRARFQLAKRASLDLTAPVEIVEKHIAPTLTKPDAVTDVTGAADEPVTVRPSDVAAALIKLGKTPGAVPAPGTEVAKRDMDPDVGGGVDRDKLDASDFVFPDERDFPVVTPGDVSDAASSWGRYKGKHSFDEFKAKLTALAKRKGAAFTKELPESWKEEGGKAGKAEDADLGKGKAKQCPGCNTFNDSDAGECSNCGKELGSSGAEGPAETGKEKAAKKTGPACPECGKQGGPDAKFCDKCGSGMAVTKAKHPAAEPADAAVSDAIGDLQQDVDTALAAQANDPDATHPADAKVTQHLQDAKDNIDAAAAAQRLDEDTDSPAQHAGATKSADLAYHLVRLHDVTCAAYSAEAVTITHPAAAKGVGHVTDPAAFAAMVSAALTEDGGSGSRAGELPGLSRAYQLALTLKAADPALLDEAMSGLRKAFADMYPDAHPTPQDIQPGQFQRPYITAGRANQSAAAGQEPRIPLASHVPDPADFRRPLITGGREAASPGSNPAGKAGEPDLVKQRTYYTNAGRDQATEALTAMHDYIAGAHPGVCPMHGRTPDGENAVPGSMGSTVTTAAPVPETFTRTQDTAIPVPVTPGQAAAAVTQDVTKKDKAAKAARRAAKEARRAAAAAAARQDETVTTKSAAPADPDLLARAIEEATAGLRDDYEKTIADLTKRISDLEASPDPAQMAPRSAAASITAPRQHESQEVPAGGDDGAYATERLVRLVKRAKNPDTSVSGPAIDELMTTYGREALVELLA